MAQYINKDALVGELEKRIKTNKECMLGLRNLDYYQGKVDALNDTISSLDTLEAKEVDLEKEIDKFYGMYRKNGKTYSTEDNEECLDWKVDCNPNFEKGFAKHFFELGMAVNNKAQKGE